MDLTFDFYSGRPNPSFHLPLEIAAKIFGLISDQPLVKITAATLPSRLGYRGLNVVLPPAIVTRYRVPPVFNIPADTFEHLSLLKDLAAVRGGHACADRPARSAHAGQSRGTRVRRSGLSSRAGRSSRRWGARRTCEHFAWDPDARAGRGASSVRGFRPELRI